MQKERFVIVDGHALIHRAYHAIPPLTNSKGDLVNAVYGFTTILFKVIKDLKPKYIAVAFDLPGKTVRHHHFEAYKANRAKAPDELIKQFDIVREVVKAFSIPGISQEGYEADDVIGTIVKKNPKNIENIIVTGDMDELQLVDEQTKVYTMKRGFTDTVIYDEAMVFSRYGLTPEQFIDYKALRGDPSDNIPGVSGVGEKTATSLIAEYGSLDEVYKSLDNIKENLAQKLRGSKDIAYLSKKLATIETNLDINLSLNECLLHDFDSRKALDMLLELGFKSLIPKMPNGRAEKSVQKVHEKGQYRLINKIDDFKKLLKTLGEQKEFAFDTETDSLSEIDANLVGMSFSFKKRAAFYVPVGHKNGPQLDRVAVLRELKSILENPKIGKIGHNIKYDYVVMKKYGIEVGPIVFDTMVGAYLLNSNARSPKLDDLALSELGFQKIKITDLIGAGKEQRTFDEVDVKLACDYSSEDADITWRLYLDQKIEIEKHGLSELNEKIESPLISVLGEIENNGIKLDKNKLHKTAEEVEKTLLSLNKEIRKYAGQEININSPIQLQKLFFDKLKIQEKISDPRELKKLKNGGYSTSAQELEKLKDAHPIVRLILEYREQTKLKNTYIEVLPKLINKRTGRIHTSFNQTIAQTGRLSSSDPNLQNIPIRTETGKKIRDAFVAEKGYKIISADYSQIELRMIAHIAKDASMREIFQKRRDIHSETAAKVFNVPEDKVTKEMRRVAKVINFGIIYGVSAHGLKQQTGMTREEGQKLIDRYFEIHPEIKKYTEDTIKTARELGYVETIFGRKRFLPEINSSNFAVRGAAERMAINMPVQGTAADLMKLAMIDITRGLPHVSKNSKVILQVHDEILVETPDKEVEKVAKFVKEKMENVIKLDVPIEAAVSWGESWGEAK